MERALNQATAPGLSYQEFLALARRLGCIGVEPRNDLPRPLFDGMDPADAGRMARDTGLRLVGLSQVYPLNDWSDERGREVASLITTARAAGAETVSLIPRVDGKGIADGERQANLRSVLAEILPMLRGAGMIGLVEPIGFTASGGPGLRSPRGDQEERPYGQDAEDQGGPPRREPARDRGRGVA